MKNERLYGILNHSFYLASRDREMQLSRTAHEAARARNQRTASLGDDFGRVLPHYGPINSFLLHHFNARGKVARSGKTYNTFDALKGKRILHLASGNGV